MCIKRTQINLRAHGGGHSTVSSRAPPHTPGSAAACPQPGPGQKPPRCRRVPGAMRGPERPAPPIRFLFTPARSRALFAQRGRAHAPLVLSAGLRQTRNTDCHDTGGVRGGRLSPRPAPERDRLPFPGRRTRLPAALSFWGASGAFSRLPGEAGPAVPGMRQSRSLPRGGRQRPGRARSPPAPAPLTLHVVQLGPLLLQLALQALGLIFQGCQGLVLTQPLGCHLCKGSRERDEMRAGGRRSLLAWLSGMLLRLLLPQQRRRSRPGLPPPPHADVQGRTGCSSSPVRSQHLPRHPWEPAALASPAGSASLLASRQAAGTSLASRPPPTHRLPPADICCTSQAIFPAPKGLISPEIHAKGCFCFAPKLVPEVAYSVGEGGGGARHRSP